jgi:hypothetical protein
MAEASCVFLPLGFAALYFLLRGAKHVADGAVESVGIPIRNVKQAAQTIRPSGLLSNSVDP